MVTGVGFLSFAALSNFQSSLCLKAVYCFAFFIFHELLICDYA